MDEHADNHLFQHLLLQYSSKTCANERKQLEEQIWQNYGAEVAVFVLDMSGFSLLSQRYGIVHYLSMVKRMQLTVAPVIESYGGTIVKFEADNCFATFTHPEDAIKASIDISNALAEQNRETPDEFDIRIACGIDFGKILMIGNNDFFGNAVNRASKLGEDIANGGELLITDTAFEHIASSLNLDFHPMDLAISGIEIKAMSLKLPH